MTNRLFIGLAVMSLALAALGAEPLHARDPGPALRHYAPAGLWDSPSEACKSKCGDEVLNVCLANIDASAPVQSRWKQRDACEEEYSLCLYFCMCENCKQDQQQTP